MTIITYLSLFVCLLGLVIWGMCVGVSKGWFAEVGRLAYFAGLLAFLMMSGALVETCSGPAPTTHHFPR
jgi:hypothetical protein